ncbi:MAG: UDP-N-acetyl-D-glucosamine 6-dehydrogenase [Chlamydiia bacterium]|nr:UDP-N-acetyl-D-glucosamine 6-dehydrogenase [Chlamydiia bacterium]
MDQSALIGVIGLGYVGLQQIEIFLQKGFSGVGYEIDESKVSALKEKKSYINYLDLTDLFTAMDEGRFTPSTDENILHKADVILVCVPTNLDANHLPDLKFVKSAAQTIKRVLRKGQLIILQSTVYPGATQEEIVDLLSEDGLQVGRDFFVAYSPEMTDPGNAHDIPVYKIPKIVGGTTEECLKRASSLFSHVAEKIKPCTSTQIAESAKLLQNTFRLINVSLINELKMALDPMGINIWEVIEAASTKPFGFVPFYPSAGVGGACIPIDPFYLSWKAKAKDASCSMIEAAGQVNIDTHKYVVDKVITALNWTGKSVKGAKILVLGIGFKKDVNDWKESPALSIVNQLQTLEGSIFYHDPLIETFPMFNMQSIQLHYDKLPSYDCVVIVTDHSCYDWDQIAKYSQCIVDTRNVVSGKHVIRG